MYWPEIYKTEPLSKELVVFTMALEIISCSIKLLVKGKIQNTLVYRVPNTVPYLKKGL